MINKLRKDVQDGECFKYDPPLIGATTGRKGYVAGDRGNLPPGWACSDQTANIDRHGTQQVIMLEHYSTHPAGVPREEHPFRPSFEDDCGTCGQKYGKHFGMNCDPFERDKLGARLFTPALGRDAPRHAGKPFVMSAEEMRAEIHASRLRAEKTKKTKRDGLAEEERLVTSYSEGMRRELIRTVNGSKYIPGGIYALTAAEFQRAAALFSARVSAKVAKTDAEEKERARTVVVADRDEDYWP